MLNMRQANICFLSTLCSFFVACSSSGPLKVVNREMGIEFNEKLESRLVRVVEGQLHPVGDFSQSEYIELANGKIPEFQFQESVSEEVSILGSSGTRLMVTGVAEQLFKQMTIEVLQDFPQVLLTRVKYTNTGKDVLTISRWVNNHYVVPAGNPGDQDPPFWSYQCASYEDRRDWVLPVNVGFSQENYLGMNASDYGGGTPVVDVWNREFGVAIGHLEQVPKLVSLPVRMPSSDHVELFIESSDEVTLMPGATVETLLTFVMVHRGDFFVPFESYSRIMDRRGVRMGTYPDSAYEPIWCAWGYERNFTMEQVYGALPKVKDLGFKWAVLDDGWQTAEGDWFLDPKKFPDGDRDMKRLTDSIRKQGLRPKLWWVPMAVDPGTTLMEEHPEFALINSQGEFQEISWWNSYYLCPAYGPVREFTIAQVQEIMAEWGFDGLKIDGQHLNAAPPCFNEAHQHSRPEEAVEAVPQLFKDIYDTALSIRSDAVVEICPCGTSYSFFNMPFMNQPVSSDPLSSWQIRLKGKTFKALMGRSTPYYGDHVELSDQGIDFATSIGIGAVPGTKFTWPEGSKPGSEIDLTPEREAIWRKWIRIYNETQLSKGSYLGELYDIGFDRPEAHAISVGPSLFYAFYSDQFNGEIELRGLEAREYKVRDYVNQVEIAEGVLGPRAKLKVEFSGSLLLEVTPE